MVVWNDGDGGWAEECVDRDPEKGLMPGQSTDGFEPRGGCGGGGGSGGGRGTLQADERPDSTMSLIGCEGEVNFSIFSPLNAHRGDEGRWGW